VKAIILVVHKQKEKVPAQHVDGGPPIQRDIPGSLCEWKNMAQQREGGAGGKGGFPPPTPAPPREKERGRGNKKHEKIPHTLALITCDGRRKPGDRRPPTTARSPGRVDQIGLGNCQGRGPLRKSSEVLNIHLERTKEAIGSRALVLGEKARKSEPACTIMVISKIPSIHCGEK